MVSASRGIGVSKYKECSGPGTDAVQEETGELGYYPIIDIIFHKDPAAPSDYFPLEGTKSSHIGNSETMQPIYLIASAAWRYSLN